MGGLTGAVDGLPVRSRVLRPIRATPATRMAPPRPDVATDP
jgi:hypothetical protein